MLDVVLYFFNLGFESAQNIWRIQNYPFGTKRRKKSGRMDWDEGNLEEESQVHPPTILQNDANWRHSGVWKKKRDISLHPGGGEWANEGVGRRRRRRGFSVPIRGGGGWMGRREEGQTLFGFKSEGKQSVELNCPSKCFGKRWLLYETRGTNVSASSP